jgi:hypothetical protein
MLGNSWVDERLAASQEALSSIELFSHTSSVPYVFMAWGLIKDMENLKVSHYLIRVMVFSVLTDVFVFVVFLFVKSL